MTPREEEQLQKAILEISRKMQWTAEDDERLRQAILAMRASDTTEEEESV